METFLDPDIEQELSLEPLPAEIDLEGYLARVHELPIPTPSQIAAFVDFAADAKSWYKHLPVRPPGALLQVYLDADAGRDRLRRYGGHVFHRDRTPETESIHYTSMPTAEYRQRFGHLAFCCIASQTEIYTDEVFADGTATLDPNFTHPFIMGAPGALALVPESVLASGACRLTRMVHGHTRSTHVARAWNRSAAADNLPNDPGIRRDSSRWQQIDTLCQKIGRIDALCIKFGRIDTVSGKIALFATAGRRKGFERQLDVLIDEQRCADRLAIHEAILSMLDTIARSRPAPR